MKILITICARGGSKGIPGKNIRPLNGKPLIAYSIEVAQKFAAQTNAQLTLSTDSQEIKKVAENFGLYTEYSRPEKLATDTAGKIDVLKDVLEFEENKAGSHFDYLLDLDVTSPLRNLTDIEEAFKLIEADKEALNLFSVSLAGKNPYFNMVEKNQNGYYDLVKKGNFLTRQSSPKVYELNASIYFYRRNFFEQADLSTISKRSLVYVMHHTCFDLDNKLDFEFIEYLIANNKLDFKLS